MDYLETRADVDAKRIGIIALSLGGYYAPRAAAFEKRFKCAVAWGAIYDYGRCVEDRLGGRGEPSVPGYAEHVNWVFGGKTIEDTLKIVRQMTLEGVAGQDHVSASRRARRERPSGAAVARASARTMRR